MRRTAFLPFVLVPTVFFAPVPHPEPAVPLRPVADSFVPRSLTPFETTKVERLLQTRLPCLGCHALNGHGGHIGPALDGVGSRLSARQIYARLLNPSAVQPTTLMPKTPMSVGLRSLLTDYLSAQRGGTGAATGTVATTPASVAPRGTDTLSGATLYALHCAACHGTRGEGDGYNARFLPVRPTTHADPFFMSKVTDAALYDVIAGGGRVLAKSAMMPAWEDMLTPAQIWSLVRYMRSLCKCEGPAWSRDGR